MATRSNKHKRIPSAHSRHRPIRLLWGNAGGFGCDRHSQLRPTTFSTHQRAEIGYLDTGAGVEGCRNAGIAVGWRRDRHVYLSDPRALAILNWVVLVLIAPGRKVRSWFAETERGGAVSRESARSALDSSPVRTQAALSASLLDAMQSIKSFQDLANDATPSPRSWAATASVSMPTLSNSTSTSSASTGTRSWIRRTFARPCNSLIELGSSMLPRRTIRQLTSSVASSDP